MTVVASVLVAVVIGQRGWREFRKMLSPSDRQKVIWIATRRSDASVFYQVMKVKIFINLAICEFIA